MPLFVTSLNSGSNGNCYYIGNSKEAVLVVQEFPAVNLSYSLGICFP